MNRWVFIITTILMTGVSAQGIAGDPAAGEAKAQACVACHGADGNSANSGFPSLAGQVPGYIAGQLAAFTSGKRATAIMMGRAPPLKCRGHGRSRRVVCVSDNRAAKHQRRSACARPRGRIPLSGRFGRACCAGMHGVPWSGGAWYALEIPESRRPVARVSGGPTASVQVW